VLSECCQCWKLVRYRCLTLRYSLLLSVWVDPSAEHRRGVSEWALWRQRCKKRNRSHTQTHNKKNATHGTTRTTPQTTTRRTTPPHLTTIEGGSATVRTTSHTRVGGRAEVSVGGRVEVRRARVRCVSPLPTCIVPV